MPNNKNIFRFLKIIKTFNENKINYVFLKGLYLVNCSYQKSMRPINDIDTHAYDDLMKSIDLAQELQATEQGLTASQLKINMSFFFFTKDNFSKLEITILFFQRMKNCSKPYLIQK